MAQSDPAEVHIGCPECETSINASVPPGPGIDEESHANRLQGSETACRNCGHELELYYY
ncbi:hypothetical protein [Natronorubrum thiooxidans]|jgi:hypothetical protein|uniref:Uncharacterized protein n=1 Tax=Natronorubrum thiooxidans TaxID=308853 RepID=A0A1N7FIP1_9EURY|nr:hypothetical protein [Natronorubrum thiooxidans]SIS00219.1 hypothetical protein SAMN05421752_10719 [Natronorubrum thiooxidans]